MKLTQKEKTPNIHNTYPLEQERQHKWVNFTYIGKETRIITQIFRNTNLKISYKTNNTIQSHLKEKPPQFDKYSASGVYKLICLDCDRAYIGQTGRASKLDIKNTIYHINQILRIPIMHNTYGKIPIPSHP
jgi:hypothetical protein